MIFSLLRFLFRSSARRLQACCMVITICLPLVGSAAYAEDETKQVGRTPTTIFLYVDFNQDMREDDRIKELVDGLEETVQERIVAKGYATAVLADLKQFKKGPDNFLLRIRLTDYAAGLHKTIAVRYELSGPDIPVLKHDTELSTVKRSKKLVRVLARDLADIVDDRLRARK